MMGGSRTRIGGRPVLLWCGMSGKNGWQAVVRRDGKEPGLTVR